jgi:hypothetical protein
MGFSKRATTTQTDHIGEAIRRGGRDTGRAWRISVEDCEQTLWNYTWRAAFFVRAIRRRKAHPALVEFRLCKEFGKLPSEVRRESARDIEQLIVILSEVDRETEDEVSKAKREAHHHVR